MGHLRTLTVDQNTKFAEALLKGQPAGAKIMRTVLEDRIKEMV
jgi:hypothetical protein